mgnify:CR=1 FL=1
MIYRFPDCLKNINVSAPYFQKHLNQVSGENLMSLYFQSENGESDSIYGTGEFH